MAYTVSALYGGNDGSLLFWAWMLAAFASIVVAQNRHRHRDLMPHVVGVFGIVALFFVGVMLLLANPFTRLPVVPEDGRGLNPLLQNPGMFFHPPTTYIGYVGFTVPFAFAIAALITGRLGAAWIVSTRRWESWWACARSRAAAPCTSRSWPCSPSREHSPEPSPIWSSTMLSSCCPWV